jgi:hypothetical protein
MLTIWQAVRRKKRRREREVEDGYLVEIEMD